ncbi:MAG: hypothetical protein QOI41_1219, partial [Myxococcales bacterium]|nr:hypothetical protein [Myxococcales bacterium]
MVVDRHSLHAGVAVAVGEGVGVGVGVGVGPGLVPASLVVPASAAAPGTAVVLPPHATTENSARTAANVFIDAAASTSRAGEASRADARRLCGLVRIEPREHVDESAKTDRNGDARSLRATARRIDAFAADLDRLRVGGDAPVGGGSLASLVAGGTGTLSVVSKDFARMPAFVVVIGHGPDLESPEGAAAMLRALGAEVRTLDLWDEGGALFDDDGATARAIVIEAGERPDLAVAALRAVRKTAELSEVPAIVAVAPRQIGRVEPASGFDDFIVMPCPPSELYARIKQLEWKRS